MTSKRLLIGLLSLTFICAVNAQSPTPGTDASPSPAKHHARKKAEATASPSNSADTSASPAASPKEKRTRKKKSTTEASPSPQSSASPSASPDQKPSRKKTASASPTARPAAPTGLRTEGGTSSMATRATPTPSPAGNPISAIGNLFKRKNNTANSAPANGPSSTSSAGATSANLPTPAAGGGNGLVWVNTETHVYHKEGSRYYGRTKKGKYMSEADAVKEGDRDAKRKNE